MNEALDRKVPHLGTYRRELPVSVERLYENAIDWEHLPYLHRSSFARIECIEAGEWGFRARMWAQPYDERRMFVIELKLDRDCRRWITSTLEGPGHGNEVWTHAFPVGDRETHIVVDFFAPGIAPDRAPEVFNSYKTLYARLYDEDVEMMSGRQAQLDAIKNARSRMVVLAPRAGPARPGATPIADDDRRARAAISHRRGRRKTPRACHGMPAYAGSARYRDGDRWHHRMPVARLSIRHRHRQVRQRA